MSIPKDKKGLVTKKFNDFFYVDVYDNVYFSEKKRYLCKCRKSLRFKNDFVCVGDAVTLTEVDDKESTAVISNLLNRNNCLERPAVANISDIYVTVSVNEPSINFSQVSKLLINAEFLNVKVSLILTKCDLVSDEFRDLLVEKFKNWGYEPKTINANKPFDFVDLLKELKEKKCSILMGPSGVGKTTLLNRIIPDLNNRTATVSSKIKRGKNTTRNVELFALSEDSYIVDTPGFNLHKIEIEEDSIPSLFPEIFNQLKESEFRCKFNDCLHIDEPGCIVDKNFDRYEHYRTLIKETKNQNYQSLAD